MGIIDTAERVTQDTANLTTTTGVSGLNFVGFIAQQLPGPAIERGYTNLRDVVTKLHEQTLPVDLKKEYFKEHDDLFQTGLKLKKAHKKSGYWAGLKLYRKVSAFENRTYDLRSDVQTSSDLYASKQKRRYTPSEHSVDSVWDITSRPSSPAPPSSPTIDARQSGSAPQLESAAASTTASSDTRTSERIAAGQALATGGGTFGRRLSSGAHPSGCRRDDSSPQR